MKYYKIYGFLGKGSVAEVSLFDVEGIPIKNEFNEYYEAMGVFNSIKKIETHHPNKPDILFHELSPWSNPLTILELYRIATI